MTHIVYLAFFNLQIVQTHYFVVDLSLMSGQTAMYSNTSKGSFLLVYYLLSAKTNNSKRDVIALLQ